MRSPATAETIEEEGMFTGIVEAVGRIEAVQPTGGDLRLQVSVGGLDLADVRVGDSIAVSGVCLTVVEVGPAGFAADVSRETMSRTSLAEARPGSAVNLEKALTLSQRLGGHLVSGHVDGLGIVRERRDDGRSVRLRVEVPRELAKYVAEKGSITVDGVSLTVNRVDGAMMELNIVPHTLQQTTLAELRPGRRVNLEVDLIARYVERLLLGDRAAEPSTGPGLSRELLVEHGFVQS
jgi:riboflavin synthase